MKTTFLIEGGNRLNGTLRIDSAKNAILPILAATVLVNGQTVLRNIPKISDIDNMLHILSSLGAKIEWKDNDLYIDTTQLCRNEIPPDTAARIRGSIFILGSILGRFKTARVPYPGGCAIGSRPIDLHIQGFRDLGIRVFENDGYITCTAPRKNTDRSVYLDFPSVGATENLILASVLGSGKTKIINPAREPEVIDLVDFLNACGARICGAGTDTISVHGVKTLSGTVYTPIPDRIITGSYLIAAATVGGEITLTNVRPEHNENLISKLRRCGCEINSRGNTITLKSPKQRPAALGSVQTSPYPGFPTDLQSQLAVLQSISKGSCVITENLFESRFKYVPELCKMGAKVCIKDRNANITGVQKIRAGTEISPLNVTATDLRGGVALVIAALCAHGKTVVHNAEYIMRGHQSIESDLLSLGANIIRIDERR